MKTVKKTQLVLIFAITVMSIKATAQVADSIYYNRLYYTCKVWGHAKYYHTEIASGNVDWDNVLLGSFNAIKTAPNDLAFNDALLFMLNQAGEMGSSSAALPNVPDSLNNNSDLGWIHNPIFSDPVKAILETIRDRFRPQSNVYVGEAWAGGNPTFDNDDKYYSDEDFPNESKRILALFRYWNIIHYFFPYKYIMDQNWDTTLVEFIPKIVGAQNALNYNLAFKEFTAKINDSHAYFYSPTFGSWNGNAFPPFLARFIENEMVITKVLPGITNVAPGDIIKYIDGIDVYELRDSLRKFAHGSNDVIIERTINEFILWGTEGSFSITVSDGTNEHSTILHRNSSNYTNINVDNSPIWKDTIVNGGCEFGIVDMGRLEVYQVQTMLTDLWYTDAIIFDIRNYPNGTLWTIVNFLYESSIHIANFTCPDITYPGRLTWQEAYIGNGRTSTYPGNVLILFDERTQSQAEYTCMGLEQFPDAIKIGSTTAAADGNVAPIYLPGNIFNYATFLGTYYPDFTSTQRVGIIPDIEVLPTIQGIRNGKDEVMEVALNCDLLNINDIITENEMIKLYPNPTTGYLYYGTTFNQPVLIEIYDIVGHKHRTINEMLPSGSIDISELKSGIYIIKMVVDNKILTQKIVKN